MRSESISEAIGLLDDALLTEAEESVPRRRLYHPWWISLTAAAACICLTLGILWGTGALVPTGTPAESTAESTAGAPPESEDTLMNNNSDMQTGEKTDGDPQSTTDTSKPDGTKGTSDKEIPPSTGTAGKPNSHTSTTHSHTTVSTPIFSRKELALAVYPAAATYPQGEAFIEDHEARKAWYAERQTQAEQATGIREEMAPFVSATMKQFLVGETENQVYSPLSLYMCLSMLAETTAGEGREELLSLLGQRDLLTLRKQVSTAWQAVYRSDGAVFTIPASSMWLHEDFSYKTDVLQTLSRSYYASTFAGKMGHDWYNSALRIWLKGETKGLLDTSIQKFATRSEDRLVLLSTLYYRTKWLREDSFSESYTTPGTFHSLTGAVTCSFMHNKNNRTYYWGEGFGAVSLQMEAEGGTLWLILPDEGISTETVLRGEDMHYLLLQGSAWAQKKRILVELSMPKFDVESDLDLKDGLNKLGIRTVFDPQSADFSPLTDETLNLSRIRQAARVAVDEEGCTAAAFTAAVMSSAAAPMREQMDFTLDRPFIFAVTGTDGMVLFTGVVNQP